MIEWKLKDANLVRENLAKGAIQQVMNQLNKISDQHLVNCKQPQIFLKIKLDIMKQCELCKDDLKAFAIIDMYEFAKDSKMKANTTHVLCKKCSPQPS